VRAKLVSDPATYPWSRHRAYLSRRPPQWIDTATVLSQLGGRGAYRRFMADAYEEGRRAELSGRPSPDANDQEPTLWSAGRVLGTERFAWRMATVSRGRELERTLARGRAQELPGLAAAAARRHGLTLEELTDAGRKGTISAARRELIRVAVVGQGIRPVDVSRLLGISTASVAEHLAAIRTQGDG
jgi:DNA-binding CsgD family transcriptional regulator